MIRLVDPPYRITTRQGDHTVLLGPGLLELAVLNGETTKPVAAICSKIEDAQTLRLLFVPVRVNGFDEGGVFCTLKRRSA